jgi:hypothetical protein
MLRRRLLCFCISLAGLCPSLAPLSAQDTFQGVARIVAVGDVHGGFDEMVDILRGVGVINNRNKWTAGKTHLVQTGDVVDRGPDSRKVMDLLIDLEKQARKAGGMVHALFGNHEAMNVYGDLRYVSPEEYASYKRSESTEIRDNYFNMTVEQLKAQPNPPAIDDAFRKQWYDDHPLGWVEHRVAFSPKGDYGKWLAKHNAVVRINDIVFLHGGISPKYAATSRQQFNDTIRLELADFSKLEGGMAMDSLGPLWYRGLAAEPENGLAAHVEQVLQFHGAKHIAIGHTPTPGAVIPRFGGRVLLIDVGLSKYYGGSPACLLVENGKLQTWHRGRMLDLPVDGADPAPYFQAVGIRDPNARGQEDTIKQRR